MSRAGVTLIELIVVLLVLGVLSGMSVMAVGTLRVPARAARADTLRRARAEAIRTGRSVALVLDSIPIRLLPDGRGLGAGIDPFTGEDARATR